MTKYIVVVGGVISGARLISLARLDKFDFFCRVNLAKKDGL